MLGLIVRCIDVSFVAFLFSKDVDPEMGPYPPRGLAEPLLCPPILLAGGGAVSSPLGPTLAAPPVPPSPAFGKAGRGHSLSSLD